jgi:uncharacterized protein YggE
MKAIFKSLIVLLLFASFFSGFAQESNTGTVEVIGEATLKVPPNQVILSLTVNEYSSDFSKALDGLNAKVNQLKKALEKAGVTQNDVKTTYYNVNEQYDYDQNGKRVLKGHRANHALEVRVPFDGDRLKKVHQAIKESGVQVNMNMNFTLSNPEEFNNQLYNEAVRNATEKARTLAEAAGVELGKIANISIGNVANRPMPYLNFSKAVTMDASNEFAPNPGEMRLTKQVTMVFYLLQE